MGVKVCFRRGWAENVVGGGGRGGKNMAYIEKGGAWKISYKARVEDHQPLQHLLESHQLT